jgi:tetratricopeptide (TPR) repeat protein
MPTVDNLLAEGLARYRGGRPSEAEAIFRHILNTDPDQTDALHLLALVHKGAERHAEARALFERALRLRPEMSDARLNFATFLKTRGENDQAAAHLRVAVTLDPAVALAWQVLGSIALEGGSAGHARALELLDRAVTLDPSHGEAHYQRGIILRQMERVDEAIVSQRLAIAKGMEGPGAYMALGNSLLGRGDEAAGVAALQAALSVAPDSREAWYNYGNALYASGYAAAALTAYARSEQLGLPIARTRQAAMLVELGHHAEAEAALLRSLPLPGTEVSLCIELLHAAMVAQGRLAEARSVFATLSTTPLGGRIYAAECRTALAALDLAAGDNASAAQRLSGIASDNCWLFTTRSLAALRATMDEQGQLVERGSNPDPARPRIGSTTLGTRGRFAHNVLEYVMLRLYAEHYGLVLETPDWVGGLYFDVNDPKPSGALPPWLFARHALNDLVDGIGEPRADRDILSPLFLFDYPKRFRDRVQHWLKPRREWLPRIEPAVKALRDGGRTVVALHIRRGDFVQYGYPVTRTDRYVEWLRDLWPELERPVLYLASDDLEAVRGDFAEFAPVTLADVAPPWPDLDYLQDFHVLSEADVVGVSAASGFSQLAARLNQRARILVQPDIATQRIVPFIPWTGD